ncbi:MAG: hypothetical protein CM1200mP39_03450 [Dehalococcoidia bacterium]|nr:MAG: hypothetical protein CM1200mP39_03450 [Dehalococcoidia bacterium]
MYTLPTVTGESIEDLSCHHESFACQKLVPINSFRVKFSETLASVLRLQGISFFPCNLLNQIANKPREQFHDSTGHRSIADLYQNPAHSNSHLPCPNLYDPSQGHDVLCLRLTYKPSPSKLIFYNTVLRSIKHRSTSMKS